MKRFLAVAFALVAGLFLHSCGYGGADPAPLTTKHTASYTGSGSVWTWNLTAAGAFTAFRKAHSADADSAAEVNLTGSYEVLTTGFYKFTVDTATGTSSGLPVHGDAAYGFSVPNVVLVVKPTGSLSETLVMPVVAGACPAFPLSFNWVQASINNTGSMDTQKLWGNATISSATAVLTGKNWTLDSGTPVNRDNPPTFTGCSGGKLSFANGFVTVTAGGVGIVKDDSNNNDIIAFPRDTTVTASTIAGKTYVGLLFNKNGSGDKTRPMNVTFDATGYAGTYTLFSNVETGTTAETGPVAVTATGSGDEAGFLKIVANGSGASADPSPPTMWAAVANISGHTVFFASGYNRASSGAAVAGENFSLIGVSK